MTQAVFRFEGDPRPSVWKGAVAGVVSGLVGAWAMNQVQAALSKASADGRGGRTHAPQQHHQEAAPEDATVQAAEAIAESVLDRPLAVDEKKRAGPIVHYSFGSSVGAVYGAVAEVMPRASTAVGLPFGAALWLAADELAVPAFGLSKSPFQYPVWTHASALTAHLVYGITTDLVRRLVRAVL